jgi:U3 small nucleolar RNA-associated protein 22
MRGVPSVLFGMTARLLKRWLSSHMLFCQFGDRAEELVELVVARVLCCGGRAPGSVFSAFCRCLHLLAEFPWEAAPLVVPIPVSSPTNGEGEEDHEELAAHDAAMENLFKDALDSYKRSSADRVHIHVANTYDVDGEWFQGKHHRPDRPALTRAAAAASTALHYIENLLAKGIAARDSLKLNVLFRTPVDGFDGVISVQPAWAPRSTKLAAGPLYAGHHVPRLSSSLVGFDPVDRLLNALQRELGHFALFLCDKFGGRRIYVVWRPSASEKKPFSLQSVRFMTPVPGSQELEPSKAEMMARVRQMCGTMADRVEFTR